MTQATVGVHEKNSQARIVLDGEIDLANASEVESRIHATLHNQLTRVTVDLSGVTYIDSAGVRLLVKLASRLKVLRTDFRIVVPSGSGARRVVEITGLEEFATDS